MMNKKIQEPYRFSFKEVKTSEQPFVMDWIHTPHINEWLHGDGLNNTIEDLDDFVKGKDAWGTHWLALDDDTPFAYLITSGIEPSSPLSPRAQRGGEGSRVRGYKSLSR